MDLSKHPSGQRERELFIQAMDKTTPAERAAYLDAACGNDIALRRRIELLLERFEQVGTFLEQPVVSVSNANQTGLAEELPTVAAPARLTEGPGTVIDRYKLLEKIGEGGFGAVYVAEQREPVKRRVALKIIKLGMDTRQVIARFEAERQALALMDHPNIAKVLDAGATETGRPYFVMELVRGIPITQYCDENHLSTNERLKLFILVCQAIQHAHQKGIIHRDIKPSNILLTVNDGVPVPKVIDFGIAKATQGELTDKTIYTQFQQFIGTPAYMSPEQADMTSLDIDTRSDIYALGVLLYELLVGKTPFDGKELLMSGLDEMRRTIREKEPIRPSTRLESLVGEERTTTAKRRASDMAKLTAVLRGDVDWIVMKCLEKDRTRRYETANGLAADVKRFLNQEPVVARPPTVIYRFQKMVKRNKLAFAAASAVTLTLIAGLSLSTWAFLREAKQRSKADAERITAQRHLYVANMNVAQQAWEQNNVGRLRQMLEETQGSPDRGFEWYYWQRQSHLELKTLRGHHHEAYGVAFSPDGRRIVTAGGNGVAKLWDAASGKELLSLKGHSAGLTSVAFSSDGQWIVTGSKDQSAKLWEAASGKELRTLSGHSGAIISVAFSADGQRIITGSDDQTAKLWETASGNELLTVKGHSAEINSVAFSPDGSRIVTGSKDRTAKVWEAANGKELLTLRGHSGWIWSVAFSPDGQRIVTGSTDQTAKVWDAARGKELLTLKGHSLEISAVAFSPDSQRIVTGSWDQTAKLWEAASGRELLTLKGHISWIMSVAFSPDGQRIVTGSRDRTAKVWDIASGGGMVSLKGHSTWIWSVAFSPDGQQIVTGSWDHTAKLWEATSGKELLTLKGHSGFIWSAAFSPNGQQIVTASGDRTAKTWRVSNGTELLTLEGHSDRVLSAVFSPDGQRIVTASEDRTAKVWDAASGKELLTLRGHNGVIESAIFSRDGRRIITGGWDLAARVWDAANGNVLVTLAGHTASIRCLAISPNGQRIVTGGWDQSAKVWDAANGKELLTLKGHGDCIISVAFSPDSRRIVTGSGDQSVKVWDAASGRELLTLKGQAGETGSVAFSPDGLRIVTGSRDSTATVWQAARLEQVAAWQEEERNAESFLIVPGLPQVNRAKARP